MAAREPGTLLRRDEDGRPRLQGREGKIHRSLERLGVDQRRPDPAAQPRRRHRVGDGAAGRAARSRRRSRRATRVSCDSSASPVTVSRSRRCTGAASSGSRSTRCCSPTTSASCGIRSTRSTSRRSRRRAPSAVSRCRRSRASRSRRGTGGRRPPPRGTSRSPIRPTSTSPSAGCSRVPGRFLNTVGDVEPAPARPRGRRGVRRRTAVGGRGRGALRAPFAHAAVRLGTNLVGQAEAPKARNPSPAEAGSPAPDREGPGPTRLGFANDGN